MSFFNIQLPPIRITEEQYLFLTNLLKEEPVFSSVSDVVRTAINKLIIEKKGNLRV